MLWLLILPGLVVAYALFLRPLLRAMPALKTFYSEADGFWAKVWAVCGKSVTVLWGYALAGAGAAFGLADQIAAAAGDPSLNLKQQVVDLLKDNPQYLGYALTAISVITLVARLRSIGSVRS
jgi:hypothetical protein